MYKELTAVKHNSRRNGKRCKTYWHISSGCVDCHWFVSIIPLKIRLILDTADKDKTNYGIKRGRFSIETTQKSFKGFLNPKEIKTIKKL